MKISLASALGTCFGVANAIEEALRAEFKGNLTIVGQLVHNPQIVERLLENGIRMADSADENIETENVMITAHGAPDSVKRRLEERGYRVHDASCPLVMRVHHEVDKLVREGYFPVVVGQIEHVEVKGIVGDLGEYAVIGDENDFSKVQDKRRIGVVCQTTQQISTVQRLLDELRARYPEMEVKFVDTVCKPTKDRQVAVEKLSDEVDLMIVIGGYNSSNTKKLVKVCVDKNVECHHVERASQLKREWFIGKTHVGITAGTSTPREVIDEVYERVKEIDIDLSGGGRRGEAVSR